MSQLPSISPHVSPKVYLAVTGGGTEAISRLLKRGGASKFFLGADVPYAKEGMRNLIGYNPEHYSSALTARHMARACFDRGVALGFDRNEVLGIASTAALKVDNEREGRKHRASIATFSAYSTTVYELELDSELPRVEQERLLTNYIQMVMNDASDTLEKYTLLDEDVDYLGDFLRNTTKIRREKDWLKVSNVITGDAKVNYVGSEKDIPMDSVVFSGSFNPIHTGHADIVKQVVKATGKPVYLDISVKAYGKPVIDFIDVADRIRSINNMMTLDSDFAEAVAGTFFTKAPLFFDKAWVLNIGTRFVVGADTVNRILADKEREKLFDLLQTTHGGFLYVNRKDINVTTIPKEYTKYFTLVEGYEDTGISSTQIRRETERDASNKEAGVSVS